MSDALTANSGWRYATNAEVENLFGNLFQGYYDTGTLQGVSTSTEGAYANQETDIYNFIGLFGNTNTTGSNQALSYGFFRDESNVQRLAGVNISLAPINPLSQVLSPEYYPNYSGRTLDVVGTYLVRTSVIPIPAALWLFGSGLLGLIGMARRKP